MKNINNIEFSHECINFMYLLENSPIPEVNFDFDLYVNVYFNAIKTCHASIWLTRWTSDLTALNIDLHIFKTQFLLLLWTKIPPQKLDIFTLVVRSNHERTFPANLQPLGK